jgi:uncharacterized small protein (DUF1192 family)
MATRKDQKVKRLESLNNIELVVHDNRTTKLIHNSRGGLLTSLVFMAFTATMVLVHLSWWPVWIVAAVMFVVNAVIERSAELERIRVETEMSRRVAMMFANIAQMTAEVDQKKAEARERWLQMLDANDQWAEYWDSHLGE